MNFSSRDFFFMREALSLAKRGRGWTNPNPMVGAVIINDGKIVGKGYHRIVGEAHAEVEAIRAAKEKTTGATLYVNLEPCIHFGRTAPCCPAIIKSGIKRVVCAILDPNAKVRGAGVDKLKKAQVEVSVGLLEDEARLLNEAYFTFHEKKRPFIAIKFASSLDGKIATDGEDSKWITGEKARSFARSLRGAYQAVLVGINTVLKDDPHLGVRKKFKKDSIRIILDSKLKIPLHSKVLRDNNVIIATTNHADSKKQKELEGMGIKVMQFEAPQVPLKSLIQEAAKIPIISILVEGGGEVISSFLDEQLIDKFYIFQAPIIIGGKRSILGVSGKGVSKVKDAIRLKDVKIKRFGDDFLIAGYPKL